MFQARGDGRQEPPGAGADRERDRRLERSGWGDRACEGGGGGRSTRPGGPVPSGENAPLLLLAARTYGTAGSDRYGC